MPGWWLRLFGGARYDTAEQLAAMERQLAELRGQVLALSASLGAHAGGNGSQPASLHEALAGLEKQIGRAGREQLKANSIAEAQSAQLATALEQLRAADTRREAELSGLREQIRGAQAAARLEVVRNMLPALDGIDEALRAGRLLLASQGGDRQAGAEPGSASESGARGGWLQRLLAGAAPPAPSRDDAGRAAELRDGLESWLQGLTFVRQRLLDLLAAENVRPIAAAGRPFDPQQHIALGVVPASPSQPPGTIAEELRRGYLADGRVLRHAEVVVASEQERQQADEREGDPA